jgi:hypothetical protein
MRVPSPFETFMVTILAIFYFNDGTPGVNDACNKVATPLPVWLQQSEDATQAWNVSSSHREELWNYPSASHMYYAGTIVMVFFEN